MFKSSTYQTRRDGLVKNMDSGLILMPGNEDVPMNYRSNTYHFRQDSSFLYFFGPDRQGLTGLIDVDEDKSILFGDDDDLDNIIWMGKRTSIHSLGEQAGVDECLPLIELEKVLKDALNKGRPIHYLPPYRKEKLLKIAKWLGTDHSVVIERASDELIRNVVHLRSVKSPEEVAEIEKAVDIAHEMH
ncbi:MAG: aminopeptidase P N-terminal domain-containing protein, partial [Bacteroidales bacterium]